MKEFESKIDTKQEISIKQKKKVEHEFFGIIIPYDGHTIWKINTTTLEIEKVEFSNATYKFGEENKKEIIIKKGFVYISALNKKNALKKYKAGTNGCKPITKNPFPLYKMKKRKK